MCSSKLRCWCVRWVAAVAVVLGATISSAQAAPITFDFTGSSSVGSIGHVQTFTNSGVTNDAFTITSLDVATVPEPASMMLLGAGLTGLAARMRRRRSQATAR